MTLINTSILSAISTIIRIITGFISVKFIAIYIGPSGLAIIGQMQNFISMITSIASAGVTSGVVKYTAEYYDNDKIKEKVWSSALKISLTLIIPIAITIFLLSDFLSIKLLNTKEYSSIFKIFAISILFFVLNSFLTSILNGQKEIKKLTFLNIISSIFALGITIWLIIDYKLYGALIASIISQSIIFLISLFFVIKSSWFKLSFFFGNMDKEYRNKLLHYSAMALVSGTMIPISHIYIRNYIGMTIGWDEAGYWQAIWRISETYLMLITTTLSIYYLPKLASIQNKQELRAELLSGYKMILPLAIIMASSIYIFRDFIINILFSDSFSPMANLFLYQLIGDVIKIASWLLGYIMLAKAMTKLYILSEIFFTWSFIGFIIFFVNYYGLIGVTIAFMVNYFLHMIFVYFSLRKYLYA